MESGFDLKMVFGSDFVGMILIIVLLVGNAWRLRFKSRENRILILMLAINFFCCLSDAICFAIDGMPGEGIRKVIIAANTWLFVSNTLCAFSWFSFLKEHLKIDPTDLQHKTVIFCVFAAGAMLIANFFHPLIFSIDENNTYHREFAYTIYIVINYIIIVASLAMYFKGYRKDGVSKFFPIWLYIIPILAATIIQSLFYGISIMSASFAVSICGAFTSLQNEQVFRDRLTGLFNRPFLDLVLDLYSQKDNKSTGIKLDICDFRKINENYGYGEGDRALCIAANLIQESMGHWGIAIRYAADEFIILINTQNDTSISNCVEKLHMNFDKFNRENKQPFKLEAAIGFKKFDPKIENINDFLIDLEKSLNENKTAMKLAHGKA